MSNSGRRPKVFGVPNKVKIEPNLSVPVRDSVPHAVPVRPEPVRHTPYEKPPGSITVDWYPGRKPG